MILWHPHGLVSILAKYFTYPLRSYWYFIIRTIFDYSIQK